MPLQSFVTSVEIFKKVVSRKFLNAQFLPCSIPLRPPNMCCTSKNLFKTTQAQRFIGSSFADQLFLSVLLQDFPSFAPCHPPQLLLAAARATVGGNKVTYVTTCWWLGGCWSCIHNKQQHQYNFIWVVITVVKLMAALGVYCFMMPD